MAVLSLALERRVRPELNGLVAAASRPAVPPDAGVPPSSGTTPAT